MRSLFSIQPVRELRFFRTACTGELRPRPVPASASCCFLTALRKEIAGGGVRGGAPPGDGAHVHGRRPGYVVTCAKTAPACYFHARGGGRSSPPRTPPSCLHVLAIPISTPPMCSLFIQAVRELRFFTEPFARFSYV